MNMEVTWPSENSSSTIGGTNIQNEVGNIRRWRPRRKYVIMDQKFCNLGKGLFVLKTRSTHDPKTGSMY